MYIAQFGRRLNLQLRVAFCNCANVPRKEVPYPGLWFVVRIYHVSFVLLCDASFISVVEPQFLLYIEPYMLAQFSPKLVVVNNHQKGRGGPAL
jgi:hypothetical protein